MIQYHPISWLFRLRESIENNQNIAGLDTVGVEQIISKYADDTTLFIAPEENSLRECMQVLNKFHHISGLQMFEDFLLGKKPPNFQQEILELLSTLGG